MNMWLRNKTRHRVYPSHDRTVVAMNGTHQVLVLQERVFCRVGTRRPATPHIHLDLKAENEIGRAPPIVL